MTLGDHMTQNESLKGPNSLTYAEHNNNPDKYEEHNGSEHAALQDDQEGLSQSVTPLDKRTEHEYMMEQGGDPSLKDRYGKPKQHGTLWEPPIVYVNTELSSRKSSPNIKSMESSLIDHRFHESQPPSSPKGQKMSCSCCHPDQIHYRHSSELPRHLPTTSGHHLTYDTDRHHEVFYLPIEGDERSSHYQLRHSCNCSSCQKGRVEAVPSHSSHISSKDTRRDVISSNDSLRSLLPQPGSRPVSKDLLVFTLSWFCVI